MKNRIDVIFKYKKDGQEVEDIYEIKENDSRKALAKMVAFSYQQYVRKDIEIISIEAVQYVPARYDIKLNPDGKININGNNYSLTEDIFGMFDEVENLVLSSSENVLLKQNIEKKQPASVVEKKEELVNRPSGGSEKPSKPVDVNYVKIIKNKSREKINLKVVAVGESHFIPTEEERDAGILKVITFSKPKKVIFDPLFDDSKWPIKKGDVFSIEIVYERVVNGSTQKVYLVYDEGKNIKMEIPVDMFNDYTEIKSRDDSFIQKKDGQVIGSASGKEEFSEDRSGGKKGKEVIYESIPLQRA